MSGAVAAALGFGLGGEELADGVEGLDIGNGIGAWGAADGGLVDEDDVVKALDALEVAIDAGGIGTFDAAEAMGDGFIEDVVDEGGFAGAGDAGDGDEQVEGDIDVEAAEVVGASAAEAEPFF